MSTSPMIVVAVPLDHGVNEVIEAAGAIAGRLGASILPVHAHRPGDDGLPDVRDNGGARASIAAWLAPLRQRGIEVLEPVVEHGRVEQVVALAAARHGAMLVVAGSGSGATIRKWLLGSTADRLLRASRVPVFLARGTLPSPTAPVLCPVDLGIETRLSIAAGLRWARLFGAPLRILHVRPEMEPGDGARTLAVLDREDAGANETIGSALASLEASGVDVEVRILGGGVVEQIEREASEAGIIVAVQPDWEALVPGSLDSRLARWIHGSSASIVAIRDDDVPRQRELREERARFLVTLLREAETALGEGDAARAERLLDNAKLVAPASPRVEEALARSLTMLGRGEEAERHAALARWLRDELG
jgi:nucleotide-binding universal stress UspA family protein